MEGRSRSILVLSLPVETGGLWLSRQRTEGVRSWQVWRGGTSQPRSWADVIRWRVHPAQVFIIEALSWIERPLSATELNALRGGNAGIHSFSYHLSQLAKSGIVERVARLRVREYQGRKPETFFFFAYDPSWVCKMLEEEDPRDFLMPIAQRQLRTVALLGGEL